MSPNDTAFTVKTLAVFGRAIVKADSFFLGDGTAAFATLFEAGFAGVSGVTGSGTGLGLGAGLGAGAGLGLGSGFGLGVGLTGVSSSFFGR